MLIPVILGGGSGTRLWPLSRKQSPKQFVELFGERSMLQATAERVAAVEAAAPPIAVVGIDYSMRVMLELTAGGRQVTAMVLEPQGRNTAPAVAVAALEALALDPDAVLLVLPSDHLIGDEVAFAAGVGEGRRLAEAGYLVTFGIVPDRPETGYGYIKPGAEIDDLAGRRVEQFVEKPDAATAAHYLESGDYLWNSGMFVFRAAGYLEQLGEHAPEILEAAERAVAGANRTGPIVALDEEAFAACPAESIDYAVMEHTDRAAVVPLQAAWSDVGSWRSVWEVSRRDGDDNVLAGDVLALGTRRSYVRVQDRLVVVVGMEDVVVVDTEDGLLVCHLDDAEVVKEAVKRLADQQRPEVESFPE